MLKKVRIFLSAVMIAFVGSAVVTVSPAEAVVCKKGAVSALGQWSWTYAGARHSARRAWRGNVRRRYGRGYSKWWRATGKSYGCWQYKSRERCRARARPCRRGS